MTMPRSPTITSHNKARGDVGDGVGDQRSIHGFLPGRSSPLDAILSPKTVAVIGATETSGSVGRTVMENLGNGGFGGAVFPVNPKRARVLGIKTFARIGDVPEPVDLALIVTPASTVPGIVAECAAAGVKGVVVISAGFKETGNAGRELEAEIMANARSSGMRIIGPNCLGVMLPRIGLNATFAAGIARPGNVAFLSQSGALCTAILDWSLRENVGFSAFVSLGSMLDVGWGDMIDHFGADPNTKSIVCYMESVGDARAFLSAAREVSFTKPIIVIKVGHTEAASKAVVSHTGSLTGSDAVLDAAFRRVGVLRVDTIEELFDMAEVLSKQPRPRGPRLAIVTNAGGPAALATDMLVDSGGKLAQLDAATLAALDKLLPVAWSHGNPVDLLGAANAELYGRAVELVLNDANADGALVILTPQAMTEPADSAMQLALRAKESSKPILASWMGGDSMNAALITLNAARVPTYEYPDAAVRAFAFMWRYSDNLRLLYERPSVPQFSGVMAEGRRLAEKLIASVRETGRTLLTEVESQQVLVAYGIPVVKTVVARSEQEAVTHAQYLGFPVVLKVFSKTVTHKTDVGGVHLDLHSATGVRRAWRAIKRSVCEKSGSESFDGVVVQPMVARGGIELILGSSIDPQFGPVLLFGAGGTLVEVVQDRALGLPPLTTTLAQRLMERTRIFGALGGARGRAPVDLGALARILVSFSHLVTEQRWIAEIDINPLVASSDHIVALDARMIVHSREIPEENLPRIAIRPYPVQYISEIRLKNGTPLTLRPIRPEDEEMLVSFHSTLSERSVRFRYFGQIPLKNRIAHERVARICFADYDRELAIVAEHCDTAGTRRLVGVARINRLLGMNEAEFAIIISDEWQGHGLGKQLLRSLIHIARAEELVRITGSILPDNLPMLAICRQVGFVLHCDTKSGEYTAEYSL